MNHSWYRRPRVWIALAIFLLGLVVYGSTRSRTIDFWDPGEFITTSHILGIPHQPGTPLYVLVGRTFDVLIGSPAIDQPALKTAAAVNLMSGFFSALALVLVYLIILDIARRSDPDSGWLAHAGGAIGALFLMLSDTFWYNAIEAEVYGLAGFTMALLTWLALRWYDSRREARSDRLLYLIAYLLGLGVGFHMGNLLAWPGILILGWFAKDRRLPRAELLGLSFAFGIFILSTMGLPGGFLTVFVLAYIAMAAVLAIRGRPFLLAAGGLFMLGLSVHLYLVIRSGLGPAINEGQPDDFATLMSVLRREQYPPINPLDRRAPLGWQFGYYYDFLLRQFQFLGDGRGLLARIAVLLGPIFLGLLGIYQALRRAWRFGAMLLVSYLINGEILTLYLNFTQNEVRERDYFYFAAFIFFAVFIGLGAAAILRWAAGPEGKPAHALAPGERAAPVRAGPLAIAAAALLLLVAALPLVQPGHAKWFAHDRSDNRIAREYAWNLLAGLPPDAIVFTNGDNDTFPLWYLQEVERFRRDVTVVNLSLVNLAWYVKQMRAQETGLPLTFTDAEIDRLRPTVYEDPQSGERFLVYVRDWVVADVVRANAGAEAPRPVYFAVTVPQENMERYFANLRMEGLAFRLVGTKGEGGQPTVDPARLLDNMLGIYDYAAVLDGDSEARRRLYAETAGWDDATARRLWEEGQVAALPRQDGGPERLPPAQVLDLLGERREDVFRDRNASNLLGNYPAALVRAAGDYLARAQDVSLEDTAAYDRLTDFCLAALEAARRFDPAFDLVADVYPLLLVEKRRAEEATAYIDGLAGSIAADREQRLVRDVALTLPRIGRADHARAWLRARIESRPDEKSAYETLFQVERFARSLQGMEQASELYKARFGSEDPAMAQALATAKQDAVRREQEQIQGAVENAP